MSYKISGSTTENSRILVIKESDWSVETTYSGIIGSFDITGLVSGKKVVISRNRSGDLSAFGNISPILYGDRGIHAGGYTGSANISTIEYLTISSLGDGQEFGDLTILNQCPGAISNAVRGVFGGGTNNNSTTTYNVINYITIDSLGNATDFGDRTTIGMYAGAVSNHINDRGVFGGGVHNSGSYNYYDIMDYITITSTGDAADFGDLTDGRGPDDGGVSNGTDDRGVFSAGWGGDAVMDYITITSTGDATDFGDPTIAAVRGVGGTSNLTGNRGIFAGNTLASPYNIIDYITISSVGNASSFGELNGASRCNGRGASNGTENRGVFMKGRVGGTQTPVNTVDYINIGSLGDSLDFGDMQGSHYSGGGTDNGS